VIRGGEERREERREERGERRGEKRRQRRGLAFLFKGEEVGGDDGKRDRAGARLRVLRMVSSVCVRQG
jgi:hypothetical protein